MKELSPVWFIEDPIDLEHKQYVLLDFLKSLTVEIKKKNTYSAVKEISMIIEEIAYFKKYGVFDELVWIRLTEEEKDTFDLYTKRMYNKGFKDEILSIINWSLDVLGDAKVKGITILGKLESKIKIKDLANTDNYNSGIVIFRSLTNDKMFPYWWKKSYMSLGNTKTSSVMIKKIKLPNDKFSMDYDFIYQEILVFLEGEKELEKDRFTIVEIDSEFNQNSDIFQIAKNLFLEEVSYGIKDQKF